jgi:Zn ribbon nucleic-acid-binding protein
MPAYKLHNAIAAWNTRAHPEQVAGDVENAYKEGWQDGRRNHAHIDNKEASWKCSLAKKAIEMDAPRTAPADGGDYGDLHARISKIITPYIVAGSSSIIIAAEIIAALRQPVVKEGDALENIRRYLWWNHGLAFPQSQWNEIISTKQNTGDEPVGAGESYTTREPLSPVNEQIREIYPNAETRYIVNGVLKPEGWQPQEPCETSATATEGCPQCKRDTLVTYHKSWSRHIDCKGCGFHDLHGILGEPPYTSDAESQRSEDK